MKQSCKSTASTAVCTIVLAASLIGVSSLRPVWAQSAVPPADPMAPPIAPSMSTVTIPGVAETLPAGSLESALASFQQPMADYAAEGYGPDYVQNAPGAPEYLPEPTPVRREVSPPSYIYNPSYYDNYGLGARAIADYAPPGYEVRDYQDAPGVREFSPITPPPSPTGEDAGIVVTRGMYPGSFLVPGVNTSFRLRGFVRLASMFDFSPIGSTDSFVPNTIPVPQGVGQNFNMSGRISRFAIESWTPTDYCDWNVHTFVEGDFFNGAPQAAGGGGNPFRLRHAFVDFGYFRFGQQNSTFMDPNNWPSLVDFQGPNGWINQRQPSLRMTLPVTDDGLYWASSVERPFSDVTTSGLGAAVQDVPDFATHLRLERDRGHLQAATLMRAIGYRPTGEELTRRMGVGVSGSAVFHPWAILFGGDPVHEEDPSGLTRSRILLQCTWGPGAARYVNDLVGQGLDAQVDPITGSFNLVDSTAWNASYEHWFNAKWLSNFTYSEATADGNPGQLATTYDTGRYLAASLWWIPIPRLSCGMEYMWGQRENIDAQEAEAQRLNGVLQYNF